MVTAGFEPRASESGLGLGLGRLRVRFFILRLRLGLGLGLGLGASESGLDALARETKSYDTQNLFHCLDQ